MNVKLIWATPGGDGLVAYMARVSNPSNQNNEETAPKLISFLIRHKHWSPFEMVNACVEIETTRDIGRQILRHRSFSFQEFSQRYAEVDNMLANREARLKGSTNRQGSLNERMESAEGVMRDVGAAAFTAYHAMIKAGVAPECARAVLPEGLTPTRMYMNGTVRSWIHYLQERTQPGVQAEHRAIAYAISHLLGSQFPNIWRAVQLSLEEGAE